MTSANGVGLLKMYSLQFVFSKGFNLCRVTVSLSRLSLLAGGRTQEWWWS